MTASLRGGARVFASSGLHGKRSHLSSLRLANVKLTDDTIKNFELATGRKRSVMKSKASTPLSRDEQLSDTEREEVMVLSMST